MLLVRTTLFLVCTVCLIAQTDSAQSGSGSSGSDEDYGGPAILSRGESPTTQTASPVGFRPYIGVSGIYDTGIVPVAVSATGQLRTIDVYGVEAALGAYTYRTWKKTTLSLDYRGNFRHYSTSTWDGSDQFLALAITHRPSKRLSFTWRNQAGTYSQNYLLSVPLGGLDPNFLQLPQNDFYYNRVVFFGTAGYLTYRATARLSFNVGADGDLVRRQSSALYGVTGAGAHGDMEYRISRHSTLGADYRFTFYDYTRGFGTTYIQSVGLDYSTQFTRHLQLSARIGGARVDSSSLTQVTLDPAVAALVGESVGIQVASLSNYLPDIEARLTDTYRHSQFSLNYYDAVTPGNGVYLTSRSNTGTAAYSFSGLRYWNFGVSASYGRMDALVQNLGAYTWYGAGFGITREIGKGLHAVLRVDANRFDVGSFSAYTHNEYRASLGISYSPGDVPLVLW